MIEIRTLKRLIKTFDDNIPIGIFEHCPNVIEKLFIGINQIPTMLKTIRSFDGVPIHYAIKRNSEDYVIFLHGITCDKGFWDNEAKVFHKLGFSTIIPDLRGHGKSGKPHNKEDYYLENFARDIKHIMDKEKIKKANMVGHSFGGSLWVLCYKIFSKNINSMVMINASHKVPFKLKFYLASRRHFNSFMHRFVANLPELKSNDEVLKHIIYNMDSYTKEHKKEIQNILNHIEVPTLFVSSSKDELVPLKHMKDMVSMMNKTEIVHLEKAHHEVFHEQSKEANVNIFNFLQKHHLTDNVNLATALTVVFAAVGLALLSTPEALQSLGSATITGAAVTLENVNVTSHLSVLGVKVIAIATLLSGFLYIRNKYQ